MQKTEPKESWDKILEMFCRKSVRSHYNDDGWDDIYITKWTWYIKDNEITIVDLQNWKLIG